MIKTTELRVGNWVLAGWYKEPLLPLCIRAVDLDSMDSGDYSGWNNEPISITPSILQSAGFKFSPCRISGADMWQGMAMWSKGDFVLRGNVSTAGGGTLHLAGYFNTQIQYLHELQNLYYAIMREELEINL